MNKDLSSFICDLKNYIKYYYENNGRYEASDAEENNSIRTVFGDFRYLIWSVLKNKGFEDEFGIKKQTDLKYQSAGAGTAEKYPDWLWVYPSKMPRIYGANVFPIVLISAKQKENIKQGKITCFVGLSIKFTNQTSKYYEETLKDLLEFKKIFKEFSFYKSAPSERQKGEVWERVDDISEVKAKFENISSWPHYSLGIQSNLSLKNDDDFLRDLEDIVVNVCEKLKDFPNQQNYNHTNFTKIIHSFESELSKANLIFDQKLIRNFVVSLATKRFVLLTGLSGSGKTQLALQFGQWLGHYQYKVVPVRPDWTGPEALFGYEDALQEPSKDGRRAWHVPEPLEFMLKAADNPNQPYLLILDEMNLAHVERYFADAVSGMETDENCIPNLEEKENYWRVPKGESKKRPLPKNLFIVGTVNVDETTYMFSPKILDRANTLEFRVTTEDLTADLKEPGKCESGADELVRGFLAISTNDNIENGALTVEERNEFVDYLKILHKNLDVSFSFGHRVLYESLRFAELYQLAGGNGVKEALDVQILQKVLPRLHGGRRRLEPVLRIVSEFCFSLECKDEGSFEPTAQDSDEAKLPRSFQKTKEMLNRLRANQFVSFTE